MDLLVIVCYLGVLLKLLRWVILTHVGCFDNSFCSPLICFICNILMSLHLPFMSLILFLILRIMDWVILSRILLLHHCCEHSNFELWDMWHCYDVLKLLIKNWMSIRHDIVTGIVRWQVVWVGNNFYLLAIGWLCGLAESWFVNDELSLRVWNLGSDSLFLNVFVVPLCKCLIISFLHDRTSLSYCYILSHVSHSHSTILLQV